MDHRFDCPGWEGYTADQQHALQESGAFDPDYPECLEAVGCARCAARDDCPNRPITTEEVDPIHREEEWD